MSKHHHHHYKVIKVVLKPGQKVLVECKKHHKRRVV
jgi:hypothetical protein